VRVGGGYMPIKEFLKHYNLVDHTDKAHSGFTHMYARRLAGLDRDPVEGGEEGLSSPGASDSNSPKSNRKPAWNNDAVSSAKKSGSLIPGPPDTTP
jgi:hypothetical protein